MSLHDSPADSKAALPGLSSKSLTKILIVDDSPANLLALDSLLEGMADSVVQATSGQQALGELLREEFALVLLDVRMPDLDGFEVAGLIRKQRRFKELPIIFITAFEHSRAEIEQAYELGAIDFIMKPVSPVVLRCKVGAFLALYQARRDLERRVAARTEELRRAHDELRLIIDTIPDLISFVGTDARYVRVNRAYEDWFRVPREEIEGRPVREVLGEEAYEKIRVHLESALSGREVTYETVIPYEGGGGRHIRASYIPYRDEKGLVAGFVAFITDITETKRAEVARARLAAIVESSSDAIVSKTLDGTVTSWNRAAERLFGYAATEIVGMPITLIIPEDRLPEERDIIDQIVRGQCVEHFTTRRRRKDGSLIDLSITVSPIRDSAGHVIGASKIARDITEEKRNQEEIKRLNADLEQRIEERTAALQQTVRELDSFAYTVSHDLRAPLRTMHRYSDLIAEEYAGKVLDAQGVEHLKRISGGSGQMDQLIQDLLSYSRLARTTVELRKIPLDAVLVGVMDSMSGDLLDRKAKVEVQNPLPEVWGDKVLIEQVFMNLLSNAVRFTDERVSSHVRIRADRRGPDALVWVEDNGIGIAPEYHQRIFSVFERLNPRRFGGTGIGLAIVKRAMEQMAGSIGVESEPGRGSRFWIRFKSTEGAA